MQQVPSVSPTSRGTRLTTVVLVCAAALVFTACDVSITYGDSVQGSGDILTELYDLDDFDEIQIGDTFEAFVTVGPDWKVEITSDDNVTDNVEVKVKDGRLRIGLDGVTLNNGTLEARVQVPSLTRLQVSGASSVELEGLDTARFVLDVSGASDVDVDGTTDRLSLDASGASSVQLDGVRIGTASLDGSGASSIEMGDVQIVTGDLSGASSLDVPSSASVAVDTSGASSIDRS